ncbi:MAG: ATP-dependent DNA helicase RecG, partial [Chloroflexota bacterium]
DDVSGAIKPLNESGMALSMFGDAGFGREVQRGKNVDRGFSADLVAASARAIQDRWRPSPAPTWVTALPSIARPGIVRDFAARLAAALGIPFVDALTVREGGLPQKAMQNSFQQAHNALAKLDVMADRVLPGPVLLVDDIVDTRWTLTVAGWLLQTNGSGPVHPFALAVAAGRDDGEAA